jgi:hypothetical protein
VRILFDKNVPKQLRRSLSEHQVETAAQLGWGQLKNGILLKTAEAAGFDVMVTADQNIKYQQNLTERKIALVVLGSNRWPYVKQHLPEITAAVNAARTNSYTFVAVPLPPKPEYKPLL